MRSNVSVGPPIDMVLYRRDSLEIGFQTRLEADDDYLETIHRQWGGALQRAFDEDIPDPEWQF
jgi:putative proteasome-type protease